MKDIKYNDGLLLIRPKKNSIYILAYGTLMSGFQRRRYLNEELKEDVKIKTVSDKLIKIPGFALFIKPGYSYPHAICTLDKKDFIYCELIEVDLESYKYIAAIEKQYSSMPISLSYDKEQEQVNIAATIFVVNEATVAGAKKIKKNFKHYARMNKLNIFG